MTEKRFMVDDAGTLIDMHTRDMFDIVEEVCPLLNELHEQNQYLKSLKWNQDCINEISISMQQIQLLEKENERLKQQLIEKERMLDVRDKIIADVMKAVNGALE
jgi:DNA polymerase sigma